ncbi:MAG TPA: ATP-binding protein [Candidatus Obscuribacterales bacterium]
MGLAIVLALFFVRGTVSQLSILQANASRFANNQPLLPKLDLRDEIGQVDAHFHQMADALTHARKREREMLELVQASKERLDLMIENMPLALVVADDEGTVHAFNSSAERLFERKRAEVINHSLEALFLRSNSRSEANIPLSILKGARSGETVALEVLTRLGEAIPVEVTTSSFTTSEGRRYLSAIKDISERFRIEQLKRDFYAMVSHDLRSPLASIAGVLQLLREGRYGDIGEEARKKVVVAESNASKLLDMVNRLLQLEKLESGTIEFSITDVGLAQIFSDCKSSLDQFAADRDVTLDIAPTELSVHADPIFLASVLNNLVSNAIKYSPPGTTVTVRAGDLDHDVEVSIQDQGPGIPSRLQAQIFERYQQGRSDKAESGFGLGLAISKSIIAQLGGEIGVDSEASKGSRFWFRLPKARS